MNLHLETAIDKIVEAKNRGRKVVAVTGSGPNIHEGVTTLIAELIHKNIIDGVITSGAVIAHEMAGTLDRVKRLNPAEHNDLDIPRHLLPRGGSFEITLLPESQLAQIKEEIPEGWDLYHRILDLPGAVILKAAGNMAWPMGLRTERLAMELLPIAQNAAMPFEKLVGLGAHPMTIIGAASRRNIPVLVSIPQLIGGGAVGLGIGDSIPLRHRARLIAEMLSDCDVIIESAIALSQEIHDGPFELYTGHGIWSAWDGGFTYSLKEKTLIRIDLDTALERAWMREREDSQIQAAVNQGLPKTKLTGIPFRMEMSGFARLEGSLPITGDIGAVWPVLATTVAERLGVKLDFMSAPQETEAGRKMRDWIADTITPVDRAAVLSHSK